MSEGIAEQVFLFRSHLQNRRLLTLFFFFFFFLLLFRSGSHLPLHVSPGRLGDETLRSLESVLVSKNVKSLLETRSMLKELLRSEALLVLREITEKSIGWKLSVVEFFVHAFALVGDVESCLVLKYEVLVLRELKYINNHWLQVSLEEWLAFADDSLHNGFYSIAVKGYENALLCIQRTKLVEEKSNIFFAEMELVERVKERRDMARTLISSESVQAQTARYLKGKCLLQNRKRDSYSVHTPCLASSLFRSSIKKQNIQKLRKSQSLRENISGT